MVRYLDRLTAALSATRAYIVKEKAIFSETNPGVGEFFAPIGQIIIREFEQHLEQYGHLKGDTYATPDEGAYISSRKILEQVEDDERCSIRSEVTIGIRIPHVIYTPWILTNSISLTYMKATGALYSKQEFRSINSRTPKRKVRHVVGKTAKILAVARFNKDYLLDVDDPLERVSFKSMVSASNYRELVKKTTGVNIPRGLVGKVPQSFIKALVKMVGKRGTELALQRMLSMQHVEQIRVSSSSKHEVLTAYYETVIPEFEDDYIEDENDPWGDIEIPHTILQDYIRLCELTRSKPNMMFRSMAALERAHDDLALQFTKKQQEDYAFKVNPKYPDEFTSGDVRFTLIKSNHALLNEGTKMGHCVGSYTHVYKVGEAIYHAEVDGGIATLHVKDASVKQCKGRFNSNPDPRIAEAYVKYMTQPVKTEAI